MKLTASEKTQAYVDRLKQEGGRATTLYLTGDAARDLQKLRETGKFASIGEIVAAALKKLARG